MNEVLSVAPEFSNDAPITTPLCALLDWAMGTPAGFAAFRDDRGGHDSSHAEDRPDWTGPRLGQAAAWQEALAVWYLGASSPILTLFSFMWVTASLTLLSARPAHR